MRKIKILHLFLIFIINMNSKIAIKSSSNNLEEIFQLFDKLTYIKDNYLIKICNGNEFEKKLIDLNISENGEILINWDGWEYYWRAVLYDMKDISIYEYIIEENKLIDLHLSTNLYINNKNHQLYIIFSKLGKSFHLSFDKNKLPNLILVFDELTYYKKLDLEKDKGIEIKYTLYWAKDNIVDSIYKKQLTMELNKLDKEMLDIITRRFHKFNYKAII